MAAFINNDITTAGLIVLAKGVAGQKINYTKIVLGDGYLEEGQTPRTLTGVVSPKATVDITKLKINGDGTVAVGGIFTNGDETDGFYYRELGLYAEDPDPEVGEVLYCYGNCGDLAEWIPPSGGATIVEKTIDIVTAIGTATNVTAYIPADAYATKEDYETYKAIALGAQATAEEALALARQAIAIAQAAEASANDLSNAVGQNTSKIATLWDAVFSDITSNPFQITFADLTGITLKEAEEAKRQKEAAARERAREDLQIITIQGTSAAIALGEATARAVQRIPDAHCNGDMHAALDYAAKIKHAQKDFLTSQGIHAIID